MTPTRRIQRKRELITEREKRAHAEAQARTFRRLAERWHLDVLRLEAECASLRDQLFVVETETIVRTDYLVGGE